MDDITAISQTILRERQGRDRGWWDQMRTCFADDATVRLSWFQGSGTDLVAASEKMVARGESFVHRLGPPVVDHHGDRAFAEVPAVIEARAAIDGVEADLASAARLCYRLRRHETLPISPGDVTGFRPAYRFLSYVLSRRGYPIGDDLYGDDQPDAAARFHQAAHAWLRAA